MYTEQDQALSLSPSTSVKLHLLPVLMGRPLLLLLLLLLPQAL